MGETAPNAVLLRGYNGGTRPMGETAPNAVLLRGGGNRPQRGFTERLPRYS